MNEVFFACQSCKDYIDAGYRWAVSTLFKNRGGEYPIAISVSAVLAHAEYWSGKTDDENIAPVLSAARWFLLGHEHHPLVFGDAESFIDFGDPTHRYLEWLDVGSLTSPILTTVCYEPRYFAEHPALCYKSWQEVEASCAFQYCGWKEDALATEIAKKIFLAAASK